MPTGASSFMVWKMDFVCTGKEMSQGVEGFHPYGVLQVYFVFNKSKEWNPWGLPDAMGLLLLKLADHKNGLPDAMGLLLAALCFGAGILSRADFILKGDRRH